MATRVGYGLSRRGRRARAKRRTPRTAIAAGALAAASIPLWPSAAGANPGYDEYKSETHTIERCAITVTSLRVGGFVQAKTDIPYSSACAQLLSSLPVELSIRVEYVPLGSDTVRFSTATGVTRPDGPSSLQVTVNDARDLVRSNHTQWVPDLGGWTYTLNHPK